MKHARMLLLLLLVPLASGQSPEPTDPYGIWNLRAEAGNQRIHLTWDPIEDPRVVGYDVYWIIDGQYSVPPDNATHNSYTAFVTNSRTYVFQVAAVLDDGSRGPMSPPVAATPQFENDLAYLAAGLVTVWVGVFAYVAFLAQKEAALDKKLERLIQARFEGRSP